MSVHGMEAALHALSTDRNARADYRADAGRFLGRFGLEPAEQDAISQFDVAHMQRAGVSALLTYGFWLTLAENRTRTAYLVALRNETTGA